jgi:hypothetical protein
MLSAALVVLTYLFDPPEQLVSHLVPVSLCIHYFKLVVVVKGTEYCAKVIFSLENQILSGMVTLCMEPAFCCHAIGDKSP